MAFVLRNHGFEVVGLLAINSFTYLANHKLDTKCQIYPTDLTTLAPTVKPRYESLASYFNIDLETH